MAPATSKGTTSKHALGLCRQDMIVGFTKHIMYGSYHSITPNNYRDIVVGTDLERIDHMCFKAVATVFSLSLFILYIYFCRFSYLHT